MQNDANGSYASTPAVSQIDCFTRDYGFASPTPLNFMEKPWTITPGNPVTFRYAVVLHAGDPATANLAGLYKEWAAKPV
jgi:hypothetical protein